MRPGIQYRQLGARTAGHLHGRSTHSSCVPAMCPRRRMPISDAVHIPSSYNYIQAPFSVLRRSPELQLRQITRHCRDALLSLQDAPCANIRSEASTSSPRPCFSSGSSLSGYASAATGSPGQDVNDPEAGRQHSQSKGPDQGSSPGTHKERGIGGARLSGGGLFSSCSCCPPPFVCSDLFVGSGQ
jgi:hypothetical protein